VGSVSPAAPEAVGAEAKALEEALGSVTLAGTLESTDTLGADARAELDAEGLVTFAAADADGAVAVVVLAALGRVTLAGVPLLAANTAMIAEELEAPPLKVTVVEYAPDDGAIRDATPIPTRPAPVALASASSAKELLHESGVGELPTGSPITANTRSFAPPASTLPVVIVPSAPTGAEGTASMKGVELIPEYSNTTRHAPVDDPMVTDVDVSVPLLIL
jgi:hypothetical protein